MGKLLKQLFLESIFFRICCTFLFVLLFYYIWIVGLDKIMATKGFGPHGECLLWLPGLVTLFVSSDILIGLAYVSISSTLVYLVIVTRHTLPFRWVFLAFGTFIVACGATHFFDVLTLWIPVYWLQGIIKLITAVASVTTALMLFPLLPKVIGLFELSHISDDQKKQLEETRQVLQEEVVTKDQSLVLLAEEVALRKREGQQMLLELRESNEQLAYASQVQRNFVAVVSHEFRTALTTILGFSGLLCDESFNPEEMREYAGDIHVEAKRLTRMITDLLDLERMKSGRMPLILEKSNINSLAREVVENFRVTAPYHTFYLQTDSDLPSCLVDKDKIIQVFNNLLSNAVKYSPGGGKVVVGSEMYPGFIRFWVRDQGKGIPQEALENIFDPYNRSEPGTSYKIEGTGLGLTIVRQIVQMHGGTILVESAIGKGSTFTFTLPCA